jgi:porphobilinogen synthase
VAFPSQRLRRLRSTPTLRNMVRETWLTSNDFIYPLFVVYGENKRIPVASMPGVFQYSVDRLLEPVQQLAELEIPAVLLFGIPEVKDALGTSAWQNDGVVQQAIREIKKLSPQTIVITDVCMCEYTDHGHCGALDENGQVVNDITLDLLAREALSHAKAGCDMVAPSDMMDGRVGAIRKALDEGGYAHLPIMAYATKYICKFMKRVYTNRKLVLKKIENLPVQRSQHHYLSHPGGL